MVSFPLLWYVHDVGVDACTDRTNMSGDAEKVTLSPNRRKQRRSDYSCRIFMGRSFMMHAFPMEKSYSLQMPLFWFIVEHNGKLGKMHLSKKVYLGS